MEAIDVRELSQMLVNQKTYTPLREAAIHNHPRVLSYLLDKTGNEQVNCRTRGGNTLLHLAASSGYAECVRVLLWCGADISITDEHGRTPKQLSSKGAVLRLLRSEGKATLCVSSMHSSAVV